MPKMPWLRLYTEILDDPKMARLSGDQFRDWVYVLAMAREAEEPGLIAMSVEDAAWRARRPPVEFRRSLELFEGLGMVALAEDSILAVHFAERQKDKPSDQPERVRERVTRHRKRDDNADETPMKRPGNAEGASTSRPGNAPEVDRDRDSDTDRDSEEPDRVAATGKPEAYPAAFETFWAAYPRGDEKKKAFRTWKARTRAKVNPDDLTRAAVNYAADVRARGAPDDRIKLAGTFLGPDEHWKEWLNRDPGSGTTKPPTARPGGSGRSIDYYDQFDDCGAGDGPAARDTG